MKNILVKIGGCIIAASLVFNIFGLTSAVITFGLSLILSVVFFFLTIKKEKLRPVLLCLVAITVIATSFSVKTMTDYEPALQLSEKNPRQISGMVIEHSKSYGSDYYILNNLTIDGIEYNQKLRLKLDNGVFIPIGSTVSAPSAVIYPLGKSTNNMAYYAGENLYLGAYLNEDEIVISNDIHKGFYYYTAKIRSYITDGLNTILPADFAAISDALLTGNKDNLDENILYDFQHSGAAHIFAVSGFHLSLWSMAISYILMRISTKNRWLNSVAVMVFILFFMAIAGFSKSVVRAGIMHIILQISMLLNNRQNPLNALFASVGIILSVNPFAAMSISLQMSFLSTYGIISVMPHFEKIPEGLKRRVKNLRAQRIIHGLFTAICVSCVASLFTMPISAFSFGYFSVLSPITNLLCLVPAQSYMIISAIALIFSPITFIAKPLALLIVLIGKYLISVTGYISSLSFGTVNCTDSLIKTLLVAVTIFFILGVLYSLKKPDYIKRHIFISFALLIAISICESSIINTSITVSTANVGNGMTASVRKGSSEIVLSIGGGKTSSSKAKNLIRQFSSKNTELLILPNKLKAFNGYNEEILSLFEFDTILLSEKAFKNDKIPENAIAQNNCTLSVNDIFTVEFYNEYYPATRITADKFSMTVIYKSEADITLLPAAWQKGDLLLCFDTLPRNMTSGFKTIIISTSKAAVSMVDNIYTTSFDGDIHYNYHKGHTRVSEEWEWF